MLEKLRDLLKQKKSKQFYADKLGITIQEVEELLQELKTSTDELTIETNYKHNIDAGTFQVDAFYKNPPTPEEVIRDHKIDLKKFKLSAYYSKQKSKGWQVTALFKNIEIAETGVQDFLSKYKTTYKPLTKKDILLNDSFTRPCSAFIDLTDFHLEKLGLTGETIEERTACFHQVLDRLLYKTYRAHYLEEIVFVIGSDMLHTDTFFNTTTKGTPQEVLVDAFKAYEIAFDIYSKAINKLKQFCEKLKVILVAGNHGRTKEYYLAFSLSKYFETDENIVFDVSPTNRKLHVYGENFLGLHHGNCKIDELPLIFAKEFRQDWGNCKYHNIVVGDKHFFFEKEIKGVRIKQLPALADTDRWHDDSNYVQNIRAAVCSIYDKEKGKVSEFEERL